MTVVTASTGLPGEHARNITLEPLQMHEMVVQVREVESLIPCGFRANWIDGSRDGVEDDEFSLDSGAGFGSRWLTFQHRGRQLAIDIGEVAKLLVGLTEDRVEWVKCPACHGPIHADWCENKDVLALPLKVVDAPRLEAP